MIDQPPPPPSRRFHVYLKPGIILVLVLVSLIPLESIRALVIERQQTGLQVAREIARAWGGEQRVAGPVLVLPYKQSVDIAQGFRTAQDAIGKYVLIFPEVLKIDTDAASQIRQRGIYKTPVYTAVISVSGNFAAPDFSASGIDPATQIDWQNPQLVLHVSDLSGIVDAPAITWDQATIPLRAGDAEKNGTALATLPPLSGEPSAWPKQFSFSLTLNGSGSLGFAPLGERTEISLSSKWPHPGFTGDYLPNESEITSDGFSAKWTLSHFARQLSDIMLSDSESPDWLIERAEQSAAMTRFITPVDHYLMSERSVKYGLLFVILVSCVLFVFEIVSEARIHPVQYGMVAAALCLFFLLLISLAEVVGFAGGYLIAAGMTVGLLAAYVAAATRSAKRGGVLAGLLAIVYGYLFFTLMSEDHALLLGSVLLFVALGLAMLSTRRLDWYALGKGIGDKRDPRPSTDGQSA